MRLKKKAVLRFQNDLRYSLTQYNKLMYILELFNLILKSCNCYLLPCRFQFSIKIKIVLQLSIMYVL